MSIFTGAGVAIVTPFNDRRNALIMINLMNCLIIIVHTVRMRSLSAERPENLLQ